MGHLCCKQQSAYVRQHDGQQEQQQTSSNGIEVVVTTHQIQGDLEGSNDRYMRSETRPSEDSTKGSETELDGGFGNACYLDKYYADSHKGLASPRGAESALSRRLRRLRHWRRSSDEIGGIVRVGKGRAAQKRKGDKIVESTQWLMGPETVNTAGHQMFKEQKKYENKEQGRSKNQTKDARYDNGNRVSESKLPSHWSQAAQSEVQVTVHSHPYDSDAYAVHYAPMSDCLPAPPSQPGSPRRPDLSQQLATSSIDPKPEPLKERVNSSVFQRRQQRQQASEEGHVPRRQEPDNDGPPFPEPELDSSYQASPASIPDNQPSSALPSTSCFSPPNRGMSR